jgi:uridine kinase
MARATPRPDNEFSTLLAQIVAACAVHEPPDGMRTRVIALDGAGGSGKSSFAEHLATALGGCQIVHTDDFASWDNPIDWWPELIGKVLDPLARGQVGQFEPSQWEPGIARSNVEVIPAEFLILEGVTASREAFRPYLTYSIWIEASPDLRLRRGLERDGEQARAQWEAWIAGEDGYRRRERPDARADLVISGELNLWT